MRSNIAVAAILLALAGYIFAASGALPFGTLRMPQTAFFPRTLSGLLAILSLVLLAQTLTERPASLASQKIAADGWVRITATLAVLAGFALALETLGFLAATFLLMILLLRAIEPMPWRKVLGVALATALVAYGLFSWLLGIPLPAGILGR
jgi:putative tricarboxylic transport membrane protein